MGLPISAPLRDASAETRARTQAGRRLTLQDYGHRDTWGIVPRPDDWEDFLAADRTFFAKHGGDVNIGGRLPRLFERVGLRVIETTPTILMGGPSSRVWDWVWTYFLSIKKGYGHVPPLTAKKMARARKTMARRQPAQDGFSDRTVAG